jgi:hypothetical protein
MISTTHAGFSAETQHGHKTMIGCWGAHHRDAGIVGTCDGCGATVAKTEKGRIVNITPGRMSAWAFTCWAPTHKCDPEQVAAHGVIVAGKMEAGEIIKGQTVEVVRGRKVPKGTVGQIVWIGEDSFGNARVGIKTAEGETVFTAQTNVEVQS